MLNFEELIFKLPLYKKEEIIWNEFKEQTIKPDIYDEFQEEIYNTYYPDDFKNLIDFLNTSDPIYGKCPSCNKGMAFEVDKVELDKELLKSCIQSYCESQIDDDISFFPELSYVMKGRIAILMKNGGYFEKTIRCPICKNVYKFLYKITDDTNSKERLYIQKIGQYPSLYDFSDYRQNDYDKLLKKVDALEDLRKGLSLQTDGYYVAAYTHFRRVLEKFIKYKFDTNKDEIGCETEEFNRKHINEKLDILKKYLPSFLYDNKEIYNVLSAGIHMLSEAECQENFETVKDAIDAILSQEEANRKNTNLIKKASNNIKNAKTKIEIKLKTEKKS
ncbi:hypothetical protein [Clostridium sp. C8-1-8]|uniref:hypothetical protein n=1 Tax=Clostridium sp. C8-1-8 TaxID=2698831 RepID=UPI00136E5B59|nr:hypothetical protein [Clostridium sp. C8-1-8]